MGTPDSHIGVSYAKDMKQTARGLHVKGQLDIDDNPVASRVHKLVQRRSVKEFSFGYSVPPSGQRKASDGANELIEIDLYEIGPTLKGMNPATELHSVKGIAQATDQADTLKAKFRAETYALITDGDHEPGTLEAGSLEDRFDREQARRHQRELRRQCDRIRLEEALGWDDDLIKRLGA
jgi:hypothetical protein